LSEFRHFFHYAQSVFAQYETNLKLGSSVGKENATFGGKVGFYIQGAFGYRFLADKHITLIPSVFIDKSAYTMKI